MSDKENKDFDVPEPDPEAVERENHVLRQKVAALEIMVSSYVQRQAGELVARGLLPVLGATAWANEQLLAVNAAIAQIEDQQ